MAKRKRKSAAGHSTRPHHKKSRRRSNPRRGTMHKRRSPRRRNPGMLTGTTSILKSGFYALIGLVITRQLPQFALGTKNAGWFGYAANIVTTILAAMLGGKLLGREAGHDIALGGGLYTVNRVIQDNFSPVGQVLSLSGLGDYSALGDIQPGYFPLPVPTDANGNPIIPSEIRPPSPAMIAAASRANANGGMGSVASPSRYTSRF